jgi:2,3-bisphosphoglycerate-dependent phosphoglycerate mutase
MSVRLWLVRHAATDWSEARRFCGSTDVPLNSRGRQQARTLGQRLAAMGFTSIWSSDLTRAEETAHLAVGGAAADPRLRELHFGELEGKRWEDCTADMRAALLAFDGFRAPDGESVGELRRRVLAFVNALADGDHLAFTHGGVIRVLLREGGRDEEVPPAGLQQVVL